VRDARGAARGAQQRVHRGADLDAVVKAKTIKLKHNADIRVEETVTIDGQRVLDMHEDTSFTDGILLRPIEAERLAKALLAAAKVVRAKKRWTP
jgi:hypothetical protein